MKSLKFFLVASLMLGLSAGADAQRRNLQIKTTSNKIFQYGQQANIVTTDSTLTYIDSVVVGANEAGVLEVMVIGYDSASSAAITSMQVVRYKKVAGTLTLGTAASVLDTEVDTALQTTGVGGAAFTIVSNNNQVYLRVKGKAAKTVHWQTNSRRLFREKTAL